MENFLMEKILITVFTLFCFSFTYANEDENYKKHGLSDVLFKEMDLNDDSLITAREFNQTYEKHSNENHKNDQEHGSIDELFKEMDLNKDGSISLVEFKEIYKRHSKEHMSEDHTS